LRQLIVSIDRAAATTVLRVAEELGAKHCFQTDTKISGRESSTVFLHLNNRDVEAFLQQIEESVESHITLHPRPVVTVHSPFGKAPRDVVDTQMRCPFEVYQEGIQSIGSTRGLIGYAVLAGMVVWVGLYTNALALLVAAMLIAPFAGPAMNMALGTARGDIRLLGQSLLRYVGSVSLTVVTAYLLSTALSQQHATNAMLENAKLSSVVVLLPLVAGAAGALNLIQSQRDSLVSGAAVGVLVAAALAPPAGNLGMSLAIGQTSLAASSLFVLALQLVAINVSGAAVFRWHGVNPDQALYSRGMNRVSIVAIAFSLLVLGGLLVFQFHNPPELRRSSLEQETTATLIKKIEASGWAYPLDVEVDILPSKDRFTHTVVVRMDCLKTSPADRREVEGKLDSIVRDVVRAHIPESTALLSLNFVHRLRAFQK
jgi:uncharacterized hydrophobic protein (TIGR00341 family)